MILQGTYLDKGVEVTCEFSDPYFEEGALRRLRDVKIFVNALKSRGHNVAHRRIAFKQANWAGDRFDFKGLEFYPSSMSNKEIIDWLFVASNIIKNSQMKAHQKHD